MQQIVGAIIVALISMLGTVIVQRKSQLGKNTEAIQNLTKSLGINEDETLMHGMKTQYQNIIGNIGREGKASLTEQHMQIEREIRDKFQIIENRYKRDDDAFRLFTSRQKDMSETMYGFVREYTETIKENNELRIENERFKGLYIEMQEQNQELRKQNEELEKRIKDRTIDEFNISR